jgi:DNA-binding beta-propeller fold protein YncE
MKSPRAPRVLLALSLALPAALAAADYQVVARYPIGGEKWSYDYLRVDSAARRIYASHEKLFEVIDADTGKKIGTIGPATRAHGVALAPDAGHGFASSGIDDQITMFDLKTLAVLKQFKSGGSNPDAIEYDSETKEVYVGNHGGGGVTVIDPVSGNIVATIPIEGKLEGLAFDGRGRGYVNLEDKSAIAVFDTHTLKLKAVWSAAPGEGGTGLACDAAHHRIFSACANHKVVVLDSDNGKVVAIPASGEDPDGLAFDPKTGRIFTSNPDGTITVIQQESPDKYSPLQTVKTEPGCKTIAFDEKTGRVATAAPKFGPAPAPVKGGSRPRPPILPDSFQVLLVGTH